LGARGLVETVVGGDVAVVGDGVEGEGDLVVAGAAIGDGAERGDDFVPVLGDFGGEYGPAGSGWRRRKLARGI
jgi:hypothetical protein